MFGSTHEEVGYVCAADPSHLNVSDILDDAVFVFRGITGQKAWPCNRPVHSAGLNDAFFTVLIGIDRIQKILTVDLIIEKAPAVLLLPAPTPVMAM